MDLPASRKPDLAMRFRINNFSLLPEHELVHAVPAVETADGLEAALEQFDTIVEDLK
jgi:hypothetical protein